MATRKIRLREKYIDQLSDVPPDYIEKFSWRVFVAHVREDKTFESLSKEYRIPAWKLSRIVSQVDHEMSKARPVDQTSIVCSLDAPIEYLRLSTRARNALRSLGCDTVRKVLNQDYRRGVRRLGQVTRRELVNALRSAGFYPPDSLQPSEDPQSLTEEMLSLRERAEVSFRSWSEQLDRLERRILAISSD